MKKTRDYVEENEAFLIQVRRYLHENPELSAKEYQTAAYIRQWLKEWNIPYKTTGNTGTVATIRGKSDVPVIAIRGDIDALPIHENTGVSFESKNKGIMHACGHDFHTTFMLGAAKILKELSKQLEGTVKIIFQEGEEIGKGAFDILQTDLLDDVETIVGLHMDMNAPLGKFSVGYGVMSSYSGSVDIEISGGSHENPVQIASAVIQAVTQRSLMNFEGKEQVVLVPTVVKTISEKESKKVILTYNFRTLHPKNIEIMKQIMTEIPKKVDAISGGNVKTKIQTHTNVVNNDIEATNRAIRVIEQTFGKDAVVMAKPFMGGEDFSRYQKQIPGVFLHLGGVSDGNYGVLHTEKTNFDEKALCIGVEYLLNYIDEFFKERKCT